MVGVTGLVRSHLTSGRRLPVRELPPYDLAVQVCSDAPILSGDPTVYFRIRRNVVGLRCFHLAFSVGKPLGVACVLIGLWACSNPKHYLLNEDFDDHLHHIELLSLKEQATSPPVTVEDVEKAVGQPIERKVAQETTELSIEQVRQAALENNLDLKVELVQPAIADEVVSEEEARFEATFFGSSQLDKADSPDAAGFPGTATQTTSTNHEIGIRIPLRTGGFVTISTPAMTNDVDVLDGVPDQYQAALSFSISQPLLRDTGFTVNTAPITVAKLQRRREDARIKLEAIRILADAERAYWNHYAAGRQLEVRHEQYKHAVEQFKQAKRLAEKGAVAQVEVTRADGGVSRRVEHVIVAETRRRATERNLKRIMHRPGIPLEGPTVILPNTDPNPLHLTLDVKRLVKMALDERMEMIGLELQLAIDVLNIEVAENQKLPIFALDFNYSYRGANETFGGTMDSLLGGQFGDWGVGVFAEVPLGNQAARARYRHAVLQRILSLSSKQQRQLGIRQEVSDTLDQLEQNWQRILAARRETLLAAKIYQAEQHQFKAGVRTSTEVLEAADFLADAQIREIQALAAYEIAKIEIAFATGTLLGHGRVRLVPYQLEDEAIGYDVEPARSRPVPQSSDESNASKP